MSETLNDITKAHVAEKFHDGILQKKYGYIILPK